MRISTVGHDQVKILGFLDVGFDLGSMSLWFGGDHLAGKSASLASSGLVLEGVDAAFYAILLVGLGSDFTPPLGTSSLAVQTIALSTQVRKSS